MHGHKNLKLWNYFKISASVGFIVWILISYVYNKKHVILHGMYRHNIKKSSLHTSCTNFGFIVINHWCYAFKTGKKINHKRPKWLGMELFRVNITNLTTEQNLNIISVIFSRVIPQYITSPTHKTQIADIIYWPCERRLCDIMPWFQPQHVFSFVWLLHRTT
jgi:hypothetical protein